MKDDPAGDVVSRVRDAADLMEALLEDRGLLADVEEPLRRRLLTAAGRVARPSALERRKLKRAQLKKAKTEARSEDHALEARVGIRALRDNPIFQTPRRQNRGAELPAPLGELNEAKVCYVCHHPTGRCTSSTTSCAPIVAISITASARPPPICRVGSRW